MKFIDFCIKTRWWTLIIGIFTLGIGIGWLILILSTIGFIKNYSLKINKTNTTKKSNFKLNNKKTNKNVMLFVLAFVGIAIIIILIFGDSWDEAAEKQRLLTEQAMKEDSETRTNQQQKVYVDVDYNKLKSLFSTNSEYTDLQKDKIFNEQYKGKYVKWTGKVKNVDTSVLGNLKLYVVYKEGLLFDDYVLVYMNQDQYNNIIKLNKGDEINFSGKFNSYTTTLGVTFYFKDGEIIS